MRLGRYVSSVQTSGTHNKLRHSVGYVSFLSSGYVSVRGYHDFRMSAKIPSAVDSGLH